MIEIEKGISIIEIGNKYKLRKSDLKRIKEKIIWQPVWEVYENFYKKEQQTQL